MSKWPKDTQPALIKFYGTPKTKSLEDQLTRIKPPFTLYYAGKPVSGVLVHRKAADALMGALRKIWDYYEHDQAEIDRLGISEYAGAYNPRLVRGSKTRWSNHAYGAGIDLFASKNGMGSGQGKMPKPVVAAFKSEGARWGGDYRGRTDPMHFEFVDSGEPTRSFEQWLSHYGVKEQPALVSKKAPHSKEGLLIETTQQRLYDLGYPEVGVIDGKWGGKTSGAIAAFKNDRKLPPVAVLDKALLDELDEAEAEEWKRPVAPKRKNATAAKLTEDVPEAASSEQGKKIGIVATAASGGAGIVGAAAENFNESLTWLEKAREFADGVPFYWWLGLAAAIALGMTWYFNKTSNRIVRAYKTNKRN
jgi:hypothetical protein